MGLTKTESFTEAQNRRAKIFKALGHPARIAILELLINKKACICNEMVLELPLSQATVSQHLKELKEAGVIKGEIEGQKMCYCIDTRFWREIQNDLNAFFTTVDLDVSCC